MLYVRWNRFPFKTFRMFSNNLYIPSSVRRNSRDNRIFFFDFFKFRIRYKDFLYFSLRHLNHFVWRTLKTQFPLI